MADIQGSSPFSLSAEDWKKIGKGAVLAIIGAVGAYFTASVIPQLKEHTANDLGVLIVTTVGATVPVLVNIGLKFFSDNTK